MNLQSIAALKQEVALRLVQVLRPHMVQSKRLTAADGTPALVWAITDAQGFTVPINLDGSYLPPIHLVGEAGVYLSQYGNAVLRRWEQLCLEDLVKLDELVKKTLGVQPEPSCATTQPWWVVDCVQVLDTDRSRVTVVATQHKEDGSSETSCITLQAENASSLIPAMALPIMGSLDVFLASLCASCQKLEIR